MPLTFVTALIKDPTGAPYANGHVTASFIPNPSATTGQLYLTGGKSAFQTVTSAQLDALGNLSMSLTDLNAIVPSGASWSFTVTNNANTAAFALNTSLVTGTSVDLSAAFQAIAVTLPTVGISNGASANVIPKTGASGSNLVASSITDNGTTVSLAEQLTWATGLGAIAQIQGPSDQALSVRGGVGQNVVIRPTTSGAVFIQSPNGNVNFNVSDSGNAFHQLVTFDSKITSYNSIVTVDNGIPSEVGHLDLTAQGAVIAATTIYTPTATGRYRISVYEKVTTADGVSSTLGGATGTILTFTDGTDSVAQSLTMALKTQAGAVAINNAGNTTTTVLRGEDFIFAKTGVAIQLAIGYTSNTLGQMIFEVHATCEAL